VAVPEGVEAVSFVILGSIRNRWISAPLTSEHGPVQRIEARAEAEVALAVGNSNRLAEVVGIPAARKGHVRSKLWNSGHQMATARPEYLI